MSEPLVCAVMLTKDRPAMAARAVRAFRAQTYRLKRLLIYTQDEASRGYARLIVNEIGDGEVDANASGLCARLSIGEMRNQAALLAVDVFNPEVFIHFDDDDVSHPNRIAEQVAHLQSSGADVVGYNELLFWRVISKYKIGGMSGGFEHHIDGEAWLYRHRTNAPGTSLCYWRKTWGRKPFPDLPKPGGGAGEDWHWLKGLNVATVSSVPMTFGVPMLWREAIAALTGLQPEPRLIASIHGGNTQSYDLEGIIERGSQEWRRVPEWDDYARKEMAL